jgi:hypothetical protein
MHRLGLALAALPVLWVVGGAVVFNRDLDYEHVQMGLVFLVLAGLLYAACWALGWVISGFMKDEQ